jgi:RNA-directed DNA polymerase
MRMTVRHEHKDSRQAVRVRNCATDEFSISKWEVWEAYRKVRANKGAAGVDEQSLEDFARKLKDNLYKLWNRLSSGSYFPPPVRTVKIPKADGGERKLGIPTVSDGIAQMVVKLRLEPVVDPLFHPDSYGYRLRKSALDAVGRARERCWRYDWVVDLDIKGFFDNLDHELLMRAVRKHAREQWVVLYIERWLKAPVQEEDGQLVQREKGRPQGGVISPLLANLFLHYAFDEWLRRSYPHLPFERYADDAIVHCRTEGEAAEVRSAIAARLQECRLELHPAKTKVVYCKDDDRRGNYPHEKFDFLGYTFRPRRSKNRYGKYFINFSPAVSDKASKAIRAEIRSWRLHLRSDKSIADLARMFNPIIRGWLQYYGRYYRSALYPPMRQLDRSLARWAYRKYKKLRGHLRRATHWIARISRRDSKLFAHWQMGVRRGSLAGAV